MWLLVVDKRQHSITNEYQKQNVTLESGEEYMSS